MKPEYWESDEKWAAYEAMPKQLPPKMTRLEAAIRRANGEILTEDDMKAKIAFGNAFAQLLKGRNYE